jgi:hypothetical protein
MHGISVTWFPALTIAILGAAICIFPGVQSATSSIPPQLKPAQNLLPPVGSNLSILE